MKSLFAEREHHKVNADDNKQGSLFYKVLVSPSLPFPLIPSQVPPLLAG